MKKMEIKPVTAYAHGRRFIATAFNVESKDDDLFGSVKFKHVLFNAAGVQVGEAVTHFDYVQAEAGASELLTINDDQSVGTCAWDATAEGAYRIVAASLWFEIVEPEAAAEGEEVKTVFVEVG